MNIPNVQFNNGKVIPILGLGTYDLRGKSGIIAMKHAIELGYRHFDTATLYKNEEEVGKAIRDSGINRNQFFVTTKIWSSDLGYNSSKIAFQESFDRLKLEYIDLYLIHWPNNTKINRIQTWKSMEELVEEGLIKSIGVSNFSITQVQEILNICEIKPVINQIHLNPFNNDHNLINYCKDNEIVIEAYTPLEKGRYFDHEFIQQLSTKYHKSPAQIFLRWCVDNNYVTIPKSANKNRIKENADIFDFQIDIKDLDKLNEL
ncbi:MAG: aldo/keto reductase [Candidatus Heimdallarchaeota archaeon]|nr:aldo/keto reductase [Candidatus Heimdallarchaeota archaeon]